jgi:hypothetical protein
VGKGKARRQTLSSSSKEASSAESAADRNAWLRLRAIIALSSATPGYGQGEGVSGQTRDRTSAGRSGPTFSRDYRSMRLLNRHLLAAVRQALLDVLPTLPSAPQVIVGQPHRSENCFGNS